MTTQEREKSPWNEFIGPVWTANRVSHLLHLKQEEIEARYRGRKLLGLQTKEGDIVYPDYQFIQNKNDQSWTVIPGFDTVLSAFGELDIHTDWTSAAFLNQASLDLEGKSIVEHLKTGKEIEKPLFLARMTAWRWSH